MEATELDILLEDLETRVERLRSLYEQYFLGIEKIPPQVAHKDVDRRLFALRREQIRNTARRFRLQTIIQRYNTFQQYWMRIMREIENGTYRRHVLRAERTVGVTNLLTPGERKRLGLPEASNASPAADSGPPKADGDDSAVMNSASEHEPSRADLRSDPAAIKQGAGPEEVRAQIERDLGLMLDDELDALDTKGHFQLGNELDDPLLSSMPPPMRKRRLSTQPSARRSAHPASRNPLGPTTNSQPRDAKSLSTPGQLGSSQRTASTLVASPSEGAAAKRRSLRPSRPGVGPIGPTSPGGLRLPASSAVAGRGLPPIPKPGVPRGAPPKIPSRPIIAIEGNPNETTRDPNPAPSRNDGGSGLAEVPRQATAKEGTRAGSVTRQSGDVAAQPAKAEATAAKPVDIADRPKPAPPMTRRSIPAVRASTHESKPNAGAQLEREKVEKLAEKLRNLRKETRETTPVSVDALAKKLQDAADELRRKHVGRRIDFDVVIKDGKAIVKPIVR